MKVILANISSTTTSSAGSGASFASATVVAICALAFTISTFWWLNARRGRLKTFEPHTFAARLTQGDVRLRIPLVLYNTGAVPIIIQDLRLDISETHPVSLPWITVRTSLDSSADQKHDSAAVFSVAGRTTYQIFAEFGAPSLESELEARAYRVRILARFGHKREWQSLLTFPLQIGRIASPDFTTVYRNLPDPLPKDERWRLDNALRRIVSSPKVE
jgi:hypothetical protein